MTAHRGFALPELMIALLLVAIVGATVSDGLRRQQQLFRSLSLMLAVRADVRDASEVLAADLRGVSPSDTLALAADSAVEFYGAIGSSISCDSAPGYTLRLPPEKMQRDYRLTTLLVTPDTGDVVLVYREDTTDSVGPGWDRHTIAGVSSQPAAVACPAATGFTSAEDAAAAAYVIALRSAASEAVRAGAPIRIMRRARYSLYRSSDSRWYLGSRRCNAIGSSACGIVQPVSGPYSAYAGGQGGLSLRYFDVAGAPLSAITASVDAARVDVSLRARSSRPVQVARTIATPYRDSAAIVIAFRNRE